MSSSSPLQWGIIGLGGIAHNFANTMPGSATGRLAAVASRSLDKAKEFAATYAEKHPGLKAYGSYEELLADKSIDAVYIATPHPVHSAWVIRAAEAGKHILCEKPLALNEAEASAMIEAAKKHDIFLMEAFMYRCHPQTAKVVELIKDGTLGEIRSIDAAFSFDQGPNPSARHQADELGGGGILDVGCYATSMCRLIAGVANGKPFAEPTELKAVGHLDEVTGVDTWTTAIAKFPGDIVAQMTCGVRLPHPSQVQIFGSKGMLTVTSPWFCGGQLLLTVHGKEQEEITVKAEKPVYAYEIDMLGTHLKERQASSPGMSWDDTLGNMRTMDAWRKELNFLYHAEKPTSNWPTSDGRPLKKSPEARMTYGRVPGVDLDVSKLVMGTMLPSHMPLRSVIFDEFFRQGGNTFDTAWIYSGDGSAEKTLGQWIANRGIRDQVVVISKGAIPPHCDPVNMVAQFHESLERLNIGGYADIYMMHRDNLEIPVGEFIDALDGEVKAGRMRAYGFSNWTLPRVQAAIDYAKSKGLAQPSAISCQFSLARMTQPMWHDCTSVSDPESRKWLTERNFANFAWTSQARGFFTDRSDLKEPVDGLMSWAFYADDNFERKKRAVELAKKKGVTAMHIAGAYVLAQPFPSFALIGPATLSELMPSFGGFDVSLTPDEMAWLNLEK